MREKEFTLDKKRGTRRILFIGDSVTFGTGVEASRRFSDFIARAMKENTEVINAGVPGWGNDQELIYFERAVGTINPDVVILTLTIANDVVNNALDHLFLGTAPKPRFIVTDDSLDLVNNVGDVLQNPARRQGIRRLLRRSRFLLFVKRRLDRLRHRPDTEPFPGIPPGFERGKTRSGYTHWSVFEEAYVPQIESAWRVTEAILSRFVAACKKNNAALIVFAFPLKMEIDEDWRGRILEHVNIDPAGLDFEKPYRRLSAFCSNHSVEYLYPLHEFEGAFRLRDLYFDKDGHPNEYGHALAARMLLRRLQEKHGYKIEIAESDRAYMTGL
jgi:lysophospholipase L1-like esterase